MSSSLQRTSITLARIAALLLALTALGCFVVTAHRDANPDVATGDDAEQSPGGTAGPVTQTKNPVYLPDSKFGVISVIPTAPAPSPAAPETSAAPYLSSSKSLSVSQESISELLAPSPVVPATGKTSHTVVTPQQTFLFSSKSGRPINITPKQVLEASQSQSKGKTQ